MEKFKFPYIITLIAGLIFMNVVDGQITLVSGSPQSGTSTTTTITIPKPSGLVVGDLMIANFTQSDDDGQDVPDAARAGWSIIHGEALGAFSGGNTHWRATLLYKRADAADVSATSFDFTLVNAEDGSVGALVAFRGVTATGGFDAGGNTNSGPFDADPLQIIPSPTQVSTVTVPSITTVTPGAAVIMFSELGNNKTHSNWQTTSPGALTELYDVPNATILNNGVGAAWGTKLIPGSTGIGTATLSGIAFNGGILVALRPGPQPIPLPVTLISFSGSYRNQQTALNWATESIENFDHFEVERSSSGTVFSTVGIRQPYPIGRATYFYNDDLSAVGGTVFYYRLKMVDLDGKFKYSNIILVRKESKIISGIVMNPNPVISGKTATVRLEAESNAIVEFRIIDISGRIILKQKNTVSEGINSISIENLSKLLPGIYQIQVNDGSVVQSTKFIIAR